MLAELALAALALAAPREEKEIPLSDTGVVVRAATLWPAQVHKGWMPCTVTVANRSEREQTVEVRASAWGVQREVRASFEVPAGSESTQELLLPVFDATQNQFSIGVTHDGRRYWLPGNFGATEVGRSAAHTVLFLAPDAPEAGATERWTEALSTETLDRQHGSAAVIRTLGYVGGAPATAPGATKTTPDNVRVHHVPFARLPQHAEAYSSVDVVVVDLARGLPDERALAPLLAWMRLGGTVALFGPRAEALARASLDLAPWMEPRFALGSADVARAWRAGLGALLVDEGTALASPEQRAAVQWAALGDGGMVDDADGSRMLRSVPILPDLFALPYRAFALLLVLFAIVIGPLNFVLVKRGKRPVLLLVTIPAIALVAAGTLFVFGVLSQGLGVKLASHSYAVLDQREHRSAASEKRMVFAGLAPGRGLEPGAGASCYALARYSSQGRWLAPTWDGAHYVVAHDPGIVLSGGFLPARTAFLHQTLTDRAERGRLELAREGDALAATNALGTTVERLLVRDAAGAYWTAEAPLAPGARAALAPLEGEPAGALARDLGLATLLPDLAEPPPASYLARLERGVCNDDCGVAGEERVSFHHLLGVLALDGEEWR